MKKTISLLVAGVLLLSLALPVFAQTTNDSSTVSSLQALIDSLKQQVATLVAQIQALKEAQNAVQQTQQNIQGTLTLIGQLRQGMSGDQVKLLQETLAADSSIYPEALITGYFGPLTVQAVRRFQEKHGLEAVGFVGPQTLKELNVELEDNPIIAVSNQNQTSSVDQSGNGVENEDNNQSEEHCAIIPPGHLIAPGWLKRHEDEQPVVPVCQTIPPGIAILLGLATSTPPATSTLSVSSVTAASIATSSVNIIWNTNVPATGAVYYSTSLPVTIASTTPSVSSASLATSQNLALSGLTSNTTYYYVVSATDAFGNTVTSGPYSFTTLANAVLPTIADVSVSNITTSTATVSWTTNIPATSKVYYGATSPVVATSTTPSVAIVAFTTSHALQITGLNASATYYFIVESVDGSGNIVDSAQSNFTTMAPAVAISGVSATGIASSSAQVGWTTNVPATSIVWYATSTLAVGVTSTPSVSSASLVTSHNVSLTGLNASTTYLYVTESVDALNNVATSSVSSFTTLGQ